MREIIASAPGKVNLRLEVGPARPDGYHGLLSVFESLNVREYVVARTRRQSGVTVSTTVYAQNETGHWIVDTEQTAKMAALAPKEHLSVKAARLLQPLALKWGSTAAGIHLDVHKCVPIAGGMAGGSADAAAALAALNTLWELGLDQAQLLALGARLGADVPACVLGGISVGHGRGDLVRPMRTPTDVSHKWILAVSAQGLSTPEVFKRFDDLRSSEGQPPENLASSVMEQLLSNDPTAAFRNDLTQAALSLRPDLDEVMTAAKEAGAAPLLSGSGPTVAAFCPDSAVATAVRAHWERLNQVDRIVESSGPGYPVTIHEVLPAFILDQMD